MSVTRWFHYAVAAALPMLALSAGCGDDDPNPGTGGNGTTVGPGGGGNGLVGNNGGGGFGGVGGVGGVSGGGMGGVGGAPPPIGTDTCPGETVTLGHGDSFSEVSSNAATADDYTGFCVTGAAQNDTVYAFEVEQAGTVTVAVTGQNGNPNPRVFIQSECGLDTFPAFCYAAAQPGSVSQHLDAGVWYVIVDSAGDYAISVNVAAPVCGDAVVNPGEDCDNGAAAPQDGCVDPASPAECTFGDLDPDLGVCPGEAVPVGPGETWLLGDFNTGYPDTHESIECGGYFGSNRVYNVTPTVSGTLKVEIGLDDMGNVICHDDVTSPWCWDSVLYARTECDPGQGNLTEIMCHDEIQNETDPPEMLEFPVVGNTVYYVYVDGYDDSSFAYGPYNLRITLTP